MFDPRLGLGAVDHQAFVCLEPCGIPLPFKPAELSGGLRMLPVCRRCRKMRPAILYQVYFTPTAVSSINSTQRKHVASHSLRVCVETYFIRNLGTCDVSRLQKELLEGGQPLGRTILFLATVKRACLSSFCL